MTVTACTGFSQGVHTAVRVVCRYYSLFTLGMLVTFECTVVMQRIRNLKELRILQTPRQTLQVYRHGKWDRLPGSALQPGDVISIGRPTGWRLESPCTFRYQSIAVSGEPDRLVYRCFSVTEAVTIWN